MHSNFSVNAEHANASFILHLYTQPLNNGVLTFYEYFFDITTFLSHLYEFYLSIKDLEILHEFNLVQNLHLSTQKSVCATSTRPFVEAGDFLTKYFLFRPIEFFIQLNTIQSGWSIEGSNVILSKNLVYCISFSED